MKSQRILTGITPSGTPHIGNYIGMFQPALTRQHQYENALYFVADYHSLVKLWDAKARQQFTLELAAAWLALGLDPNKAIFYRQSAIPEIVELNWILSSVAAKGLLNRAHAYKDQVAKNIKQALDPDAAITMGLYGYPVLMAADILTFNAHYVPVGKDQVQHIEIARDIAARFNHLYSDIFALPEAIVDDKAAVLPGLDGRKMSKSYGNTIPLFLSEKQLRKHIMKIVTNSQEPHEPKTFEGNTIYQIYQAFADKKACAEIQKCFTLGTGWGDLKQMLFEKVNSVLTEPRQQYEHYLANPSEVFDVLKQGEIKARDIAAPLLKRVKKSIGIVP